MVAQYSVACVVVGFFWGGGGGCFGFFSTVDSQVNSHRSIS